VGFSLFVTGGQGILSRRPKHPIVGGDGLVVPSRLAMCWIAQGSGFESQRGHLFFGISPRGKTSQEGFAQGQISPPTAGQYIRSVSIISEASLVCPNGS
jgi:hypothetical protein